MSSLGTAILTISIAIVAFLHAVSSMKKTLPDGLDPTVEKSRQHHEVCCALLLIALAIMVR